MISFSSSGNFNRTDSFLKAMLGNSLKSVLEQYGRQGVQALASATPRESGETAAAWGYEVTTSRRGATITWTNSHVVSGAPIAIMLQYGHGTGTGGYVQGRDYINPAIQPIFDQIASDVWKVVTSA
jgi:hypothetical protein